MDGSNVHTKYHQSGQPKKNLPSYRTVSTLTLEFHGMSMVRRSMDQHGEQEVNIYDRI